MKRIGPKYLNACSLNGTMHAEKQAETGCTLGFALDYYFSQVTNFIVYILKLIIVKPQQVFTVPKCEIKYLTLWA